MFIYNSTSKRTDSESRRSKLIEKEIKGDKKSKDDVIKILLLGTGDAGKSTFLKQLNLLHSDKGELDKQTYVDILRENCLLTMQQLLGCNHPDYKLPVELQKHSKKVLKATDLLTVVSNIEVLASNEFIFNIFYSRGYYKIQIPCVSEYYWANAGRFASDGFIPTRDDILRCRLKTTGIQTVDFSVDHLKFTVVDVGGQRSERRKWLHCFDNVTAIIFLSALDEYDMYLEEDEEKSRFNESLNLWSEVTGSQFFCPQIWILFLNKQDSLKKKVEYQSIHKYYDDISEEDGKNLDKCVEYFKKKYESNYNGSSTFYVYTTCALDTDNCQKVFDAIRDGVVNAAISLAY